MKKRIFAVLILLTLAFTFAIPAFAENGNRYIVDECDKISETDLAELENEAERINSEFGVNVVLMITDNSGEQSNGDYIGAYYQSVFGGADGIICGHDLTANEIAWRSFGSVLTGQQCESMADAYNAASTYSSGAADYLAAARQCLASGTAVGTEEPVQETEAPAATAQPVGEPGAHVVDLAELLTPAERNQLTQTLTRISNAHNCDVVVVTTRSIGNKSPMTFADDYYDQNGYRTDGILLLISMADHDWWVSTAGRAIPAVTDDALKKIEKSIVDDLHYENYASAFNTYANLCDDFLTRAENGKPYKEKPISAAFAGISAAIVGLITGGIGTGSMSSKLKSVRRKSSASDYVRRDSLNVMDASEYYLYSNVTRTPIETESRSGGGGGGVHVSSSGVSHGGGGGKF